MAIETPAAPETQAATALRSDPVTFFRQVATLAGKDLRSELRTKETLNASISFSLVILLLFSFAFDPTADQVREIAGGLLWLVFTFASALILNRSFSRELVNDCLDALLSSPASPAQIFLGKTCANYVLLLAVECISLPVFGIFYNVRWSEHVPLLSVVVLLASWGLTVIGTLFSALTVNLRLRELMLPVLVYPMMIPLLMAAIQLTTVLLSGEAPGAENAIWFRVLIAFDAIFTLLSLAFVETVLVG